MTETIEIPFGLWAWMSPKNHVLDKGPDPPWEGAFLRGKGGPLQSSIGTLCHELCKHG